MKTVRFTYEIEIRGEMSDQEAITRAKAKLATPQLVPPPKIEVIDEPESSIIREDEPPGFKTDPALMPIHL